MESSYPEQISIYRDVSERLLSAIAVQSLDQAAYEAAHDCYEDRRRAVVLDGVPGARDRYRSDVREAMICRALAAQTDALRSARDRLRASNTELESARVQERTERETLRSFHAVAAAQ